MDFIKIEIVQEQSLRTENKLASKWQRIINIGTKMHHRTIEHLLVTDGGTLAKHQSPQALHHQNDIHSR